MNARELLTYRPTNRHALFFDSCFLRSLVVLSTGRQGQGGLCYYTALHCPSSRALESSARATSLFPIEVRDDVHDSLPSRGMSTSLPLVLLHPLFREGFVLYRAGGVAFLASLDGDPIDLFH